MVVPFKSNITQWDIDHVKLTSRLETAKWLFDEYGNQDIEDIIECLEYEIEKHIKEK